MRQGFAVVAFAGFRRFSQRLHAVELRCSLSEKPHYATGMVCLLFP